MESYIVKHKDEKVRARSRSGGIFTALSDVILNDGGVVYGCAMNENNKAVHLRAENKLQRDAFCGSKYVQSDMRGVLNQIKKDLKEGRTVLFSGCTCQVAGVESFCKDINTGKLFTISILCHGAPSPLILDEYIKRREKRNKAKVTGIDFRNKAKYGWADHRETIFFNNKEKDSAEYTQIFYTGVATRESCFHCPYRSPKQPGDIVICDAWGVDKYNADFNDNKGVSLAVSQNDKGLTWLKTALNDCDYRCVDIKDFMQRPFIRPYERPSIRDKYWNDFYNYSYMRAFEKNIRSSLKKRIMFRVNKLLRSIK